MKALRDAEATPEEIRIVVDYCRRNFTNYTEMAVCSWFSRALHEHQQAGGQRENFLRLLGKPQ